MFGVFLMLLGVVITLIILGLEWLLGKNLAMILVVLVVIVFLILLIAALSRPDPLGPVSFDNNSNCRRCDNDDAPYD